MSILTRRATLAGLAMLGSLALAACQQSGAANGGSPQDFLAELYGHYDGQGPGSGLDYSQKSVLERYFTPETVAAIEADFARGQAAGEPPALNGDPFVGAQEWDVTGLDIAVGKSAAPDSTLAKVRFQSYGETSEFSLDLKQVDGAWRIADIDWGYDKLSKVVAPQ